MRLFLVLPLSMHKLAKARGAKYNRVIQRWYVDELEPARAMAAWFDYAAVARVRDKGSLEAALKGRERKAVSKQPEKPARRKLHDFYLDVPEQDYELVARLGARWSRAAKKWFVRATVFPEAALSRWKLQSFEARKRRALRKHEQQPNPPL